MKYISYLILSLAVYYQVSAQCCSVGSPVGGTTSIGILPQNNIRATVFFRYGYGNQYYDGDSLVGEGLVKQAYSNYIGLFADYGITNDLTVGAELGYFISKVQDYGTSAGKKELSGFSSAIIMGKYNILNNIESEFELTAGAGIKIPLSTTPQKINNVVQPRDLQPTPGAFGLVTQLFFRKGFSVLATNLFLVNRIEFNGSNQNDYDYKYGNCYNTSLFVTKKIVDNLIGILQIRNEIKEKDKAREKIGGDVKEISNSGGMLFFISPQLNFSLGDFFVSALFDYPVYKYYNSRQLAGKYSFALNFIWQYDLSGE